MIATVIVPVLNEAPFIEDCLLSIVDEAVISEILVIDGMSTDGTRDIVTRLIPQISGLRLIDNPTRTAASAMNLGLTLTRTEYAARVDAHSRYPDGYVRSLIEAMSNHDADVAGGVWVPQARHRTVFGRAIAASLSNPYVMGNTGFRVGGGEVREVDTVPYGCWRTSLLRESGGFNEELSRSQDYDLFGRLKRLGAKIILVPWVRIAYFARSGIRENIRYTFFNGYWVGYPAAAHRVTFSWRHYAAGIACTAGIVLCTLAVWWESLWPLALAAPYLLVMLLSALASRGQGLAVALLMPAITLGTHCLYGLGTLCGLATGFARRKANSAQSQTPAVSK